MYTCHILCIQTSTDGRLGWFHLVATVSIAAVSMGRRTCLSACFQFFGVALGKTLGPYFSLCSHTATVVGTEDLYDQR